MGTVYVLTPDLPAAVGGVRQHYRLVDTLNEGGIPAAIVHRDEGFRCRWFENTTQVVCAKRTTATQDDLIVIPEELIELVPSLAPGVPKIIFNQNAYTTFLWGISDAETKAAYHHPDVWSTIVVSDDNVDYLRKAFPGLRVDRLRYEIEAHLYHPGAEKRRAVAYMPRKRKLESTELLALLNVSGALVGWEVVTIDGVSEEKAAELIRASAIFLSFSYREGFGLPPAEAIACGCLVVGFDGFAGKEFFRDHAIPVSDGDVQTYFAVVSEILSSWDAKREHFAQMTQRGAEFVLNAYSPEAHRHSVIPTFSEAMAAPRRGPAHGLLEVPRLGPSRLTAAGQQFKNALHAASVRHSFADTSKHLSAAVSLLKRGFE
jgi:Glycosyl transferases group 1